MYDHKIDIVFSQQLSKIINKNKNKNTPISSYQMELYEQGK